jgi:hypothetical protein
MTYYQVESQFARQLFYGKLQIRDKCESKFCFTSVEIHVLLSKIKILNLTDEYIWRHRRQFVCKSRGAG